LRNRRGSEELVMTEEKTWNEKLVDFLAEDKRVDRIVRERIKSSTLGDWLSGRTKDAERIGISSRAFLYNLTGIDEFNFEGLIDPDKVDPESGMNDGSRRIELEIWLDSKGITKKKFSSDAEVAPGSVRSYLEGNEVSGNAGRRIQNQVKKYIAKFSKLENQRESGESHGAQQPDVQSSARCDVRESDGELSALTAKADELLRATRRMGGKYVPTPEERRNIVVDAFVTIYEQLSEHYANASQAERNELADAIDPNAFGLVQDVMSGIHKRAGSSEVYARAVISGNLRRPSR